MLFKEVKMDAINTHSPAYSSRLNGLWQSASQQIAETGPSVQNNPNSTAPGWAYHETVEVANQKWHVLYDNRQKKKKKKGSGPKISEKDCQLLKKMLEIHRLIVAV
jgi:hypothetical protein